MNDDLRLAQLSKKVDDAALIRQMCQTPGFKILKERFEEKIKKATAILLDMNTPDEEVVKMRQKIHVWTEITSMLKSLVITGEYAVKIMHDENLDVTNAPVNNGQGE